MISWAHQLLDPGGSRPWVGDQPHIFPAHLKRIFWGVGWLTPLSPPYSGSCWWRLDSLPWPSLHPFWHILHLPSFLAPNQRPSGSGTKYNVTVGTDVETSSFIALSRAMTEFREVFLECTNTPFAGWGDEKTTYNNVRFQLRQKEENHI